MGSLSTDASPIVKEIPKGRLDTRSDEEIFRCLSNPRPVTGEHNVWAFWDSGLSGMPAWSLRNVIGWVRRLPPDWNVYVLDFVPDSLLNVEHYLDNSNFHQAFLDRSVQGLNPGAVYSDIVRLAVLYKYGGVWVDAGIMLLRDFSIDIWKELENPDSKYEIAGFATDIAPTTNNDIIASYFVAARKGSPFVKRWHRVLLELWQSHGAVDKNGIRQPRKDSFGISSHPLLDPVEKIVPRADLAAKYQVDPGVFNDYLHIYLACKRVRMLIDESDDWNGPSWWESHAMILPIQESYLTYIATNFDGQRLFDLLSLPRMAPAPKDLTEEWHFAEKLVQMLIGGCCHMKLSHGLGNTKTVHLATLWEKDEYKEYDIKEGTFAAYLRWASIHLEQVDRRLEPYAIPSDGKRLHAGLLEVLEPRS